MSVRVTSQEGKHAMFDSTGMVAFGPVFDSMEDCDLFLAHLAEIGERDPRLIPAGELAELAEEWKGERE